MELNLAGALVRASLGDGEDRLPEAHKILERTLNSSPDVDAFDSARHLVEAMVVKAQRSGDLSGYEQALQLLLVAASNASSIRPDAPALALMTRADCLGLLVGLAIQDGDLERAERHHAEAVSDLEQVLELSRRGSSIHAQCTVLLAYFTHFVVDADLDAAVRDCRRALRRLWLVGDGAQRALGRLALADLLTRRAQDEPDGPLGRFLQSLSPGRPMDVVIAAILWPGRGQWDLMGALWLLATVSWLGGEHAPQARMRLPELGDLMRRGRAPFVPVSARQTGWMYRQTVAEQSRVSPDFAVIQAERWARWAAERRDVRQAAEAHWCWITAAVAQSRRQVFHAQKEHGLSQIQGLAAQAGTWLLAAGRARDAAVALELGRAVLLTERMHRERTGLAQRLVDAGRTDLSDRWRDACGRVSRTDRAAFDPSPRRGSTIEISGHEFPATFESAEYTAHAEHEQLLREIGRLPGFEDVDASPTYDDLRAAACDGPIVYLATTEDGGWAIIVTAAPDPIVVELAALRVADVEERASVLLRAHDAHEVAEEVAVQLPWLWDVVVQPLVAHMPAASLVTLIPLGALGQLPIHAAGSAPDEDGIWCDRTGGLVFRYAPNARVLVRAQAAAGELGGQELQLLTVQVPDPPGDRHLSRVAAESRGVAARFGERLTRRPSPATVRSVTSALDDCEIWHFACHGRHDPDEPLDSYLLLADGPLTLRAIFARPAGRRRLAVLSSCQTAMPARTLLDEVMSFPSALLQAGVGGVVSSQTVVSDEAAMLLVLAFFERFSSGVDPARALAEAQAWLRGATNVEIHDAFPDAYPAAPPSNGRALEYWRERQPFSEPHNWAVFSYCGQ